jgi:hypothetical protein
MVHESSFSRESAVAIPCRRACVYDSYRGFNAKTTMCSAYMDSAKACIYTLRTSPSSSRLSAPTVSHPVLVGDCRWQRVQTH